MVHNVPRLGPDGGFVHKDTGAALCGPRPELQISVASVPAVPGLEAVKAAQDVTHDESHWSNARICREIDRNARIIESAYAPLLLELRRERDELRAEQIAVEQAIIRLCPFDPNGPGTCADRLVRAVEELKRKLDETPRP